MALIIIVYQFTTSLKKTYIYVVKSYWPKNPLVSEEENLAFDKMYVTPSVNATASQMKHQSWSKSKKDSLTMVNYFEVKTLCQIRWHPPHLHLFLPHLWFVHFVPCLLNTHQQSILIIIIYWTQSCHIIFSIVLIAIILCTFSKVLSKVWILFNWCQCTKWLNMHES